MPVEYCHQMFSIGLIFVSFLEAFCGSYLALCLCEQLRIAYVTDKNLSFSTRLMWYLSIGVALGGVGIWAMHFIGMTALHLRNTETGEEIEIFYNIGLSIVSVITVVITTSLGVLISSYDKLFAKSKFEILDMFASQSSNLSLAQIQKMKSYKLLLIMSTRSLHYLILGGTVAGSGACFMHYIGMTAMEIDGHIRWDIGIIAASCLIAVIAATAAFWILFRLLSIFPQKEWLRTTAAVIMTIAVCGMHYTGMAAATMLFDPTHPTSSQVLSSSMRVSQNDIAFPVFVISVVVMYFLMILSFQDMRQRFHRYYAHLRKTHQLDRIAVSLPPSTKSSFSVENNNVQVSASHKGDFGSKKSLLSGGGNILNTSPSKKENVMMNIITTPGYGGGLVNKNNAVHPSPSPSSSTTTAKEGIMTGEEVSGRSMLLSTTQQSGTQPAEGMRKFEEVFDDHREAGVYMLETNDDDDCGDDEVAMMTQEMEKGESTRGAVKALTTSLPLS